MQLSDRFAEFNWLANRPEEDLGEDFIIHIYFDGSATGVTFHVQLKSVADLEKRHHNDHLVYDFKVKDLKHWETFSQPVVLIVWDVKLKEGRWALTNEAIADLDQRRPRWRNNKTKARVYIPWSNTTDDPGLVKLRQTVGWYFYPLIARGKPPAIKEINLRFTDSEEDKASRQTFERLIKEGEQGTFRGQTIQVIFDDWAAPWYSGYDPDDVYVTFKPNPPDRIFPFNIDMISSTGETASLSNIEFKIIQGGEEVTQLSNEHQSLPFHFHLTTHKSDKGLEATIKIKANKAMFRVRAVRKAARFLKSISAGGTMRFVFLEPGYDATEVNISPQPNSVVGVEFLRILDKLCTIQDKTQQPIRIPAEGLTGEDVKTINEIITIIEQGKMIPKYKAWAGEFKGEALTILLDVHRHGKSVHFVITSEIEYELFGKNINIGLMNRDFTGTIEMSVDKLEEAIASLAPGEFLSVKFVDVEVVDIFPDWFKREAQRLSQRLVEEFGVESVYLFGSLAWSDIYAPETDIDLAIDGLSLRQFLKAVGYVECESKFPVDLVDLNTVSKHLRQRILSEGKLLSERESATASS